MSNQLFTANQRIFFDEIDSTNAYVKRSLDTLSSGQVVIADSQTAGVGRFGRPWISPAGVNLAFTLVYKPVIAMAQWANFAQVSAVAITECLREQFPQLSFALKWPNDILVEGAKLSGILAETSTGNGASTLLIGIGLNVNMSQTMLDDVDQAAISLGVACGTEIDRDALLDGCLLHLATAFRRFEKQGFASFAEQWRAWGCFAGREVYYAVQQGRDEAGVATIIDVMDDGALLIRNAMGCEEIVSAGDITFSRPGC